MTELNIEQERREFEAQPGIKESYDLTGFFAEGEWAYNDGGTNSAFFDGWLAAKRSMQGSAEPVAWRYQPKDGLLHGSYTEREAQALAYDANPVPLYTAPPAPVSAEPVTDDDWRLVPVQCTEAMRKALIESCDVWGCSAASRVWADILAAAQGSSESVKFDKNSHVVEILIQIGSVRSSGGIPFLQFKKMTRAERTAEVHSIVNDAMECYYDTGAGQ